jgi:hypothetical protein
VGTVALARAAVPPGGIKLQRVSIDHLIYFDKATLSSCRAPTIKEEEEEEQENNNHYIRRRYLKKIIIIIIILLIILIITTITIIIIF